MQSHFSRVQLFVTLWNVAWQVCCPWYSPGKNTGVGCCSLLQGILPTQGLNPHLYISCIGGWVLHHLNYQGSPYRAPSLWYSVTAAQTGQDTLYIALFHEHRINHFLRILNRLSLNHPLSIVFPLISKIRGKKPHLGNLCMDQVHI